MSYGLHPSHVTRISMDASSYDEVCVNCGATDIAGAGWGRLGQPCRSPGTPYADIAAYDAAQAEKREPKRGLVNLTEDA